MARKHVTIKRHREPKTGQLEQNVDAILMSHGLALNQSVEKVLQKSIDRRPFVPNKAKKGRRRRPARGKKLRSARRK